MTNFKSCSLLRLTDFQFKVWMCASEERACNLLAFVCVSPFLRRGPAPSRHPAITKGTGRWQTLSVPSVGDKNREGRTDIMFKQLRTNWRPRWQIRDMGGGQGKEGGREVRKGLTLSSVRQPLSGETRGHKEKAWPWLLSIMTPTVCY